MADRKKSPLIPPALVAAVAASVMLLSCVAALMYWAVPRSPHHSARSADDAQTTDASAPQGPTEPTVASLSPAATDLIIGIGAAAHLVAVSDLDENREGTDGLPQIGDFDHVDWEKLAAVAPNVLITQYGNRIPAGLQERCDQLHIHLVDVRLDVLEDVYSEADRVAAVLGEQGAETQAVADLKSRLAAVARKAAALPPVRAAVAMSDGGSISLIGPRTFHDQLLTIAGGINVAGGFDKPFVNVDREQLTALAPDVILDLEPSPPTTMQQLQQAARYWASLPDLPAVRNKAVRTITAPYCARPGWHLADLAEIFFEQLHGRPR
jgi:iron complex transport system substrate-binding protein